MTRRDQFYRYMKDQGLSDSTANRYCLQVPENLGVQSVLNRVAGSFNIFAIDDVEKLTVAYLEIRALPLDMKGHGMYSAGIKKYIKFLNDVIL